LIAALSQTCTLRKPSAQDGAAIWRLVKACDPLDLNSCYAYLLLCQHFAESCVVAEHRGEIIGFLSAYLPPASPYAVFVWQVAVRRDKRGKGIASAMLLELLRRKACRGVCFLETTISPSNKASQALFRSLARRLGTRCGEALLFSAGVFAETGHEEEVLFTLGPFQLHSRLTPPASEVAGHSPPKIQHQEVSDG
jgi:L-2,4-diaminobutyric acid acetyltransferase